MSPEYPGSIPFTYSDALPAAQACSSGPRSQSSAWRGVTSHTIDVPTTLMPAARSFDICSMASIGLVSPSAVYTTQSGFSAINASMSSVAMTPVGLSSPHNWPASRPIFDGLAAWTPTSSRSGRPMIAFSECRPTLPVENCTTVCIARDRFCSVVGNGQQRVVRIDASPGPRRRPGGDATASPPTSSPATRVGRRVKTVPVP